MNSQAFLELDAMIARLRELPKLATEAAPDVAASVEREIEAQISAGVDPNGRAWAPKKDGTGKPLRTAGKALAVVPLGSTIYARLRGHVARHHLGRARGGTVRQILPVDGIPPRIISAIRTVLAEHFTNKMGGR